MYKRVWLVLVLLVALVVPDVALAAQPDLVGSFASGFDAFLGNGQNEQVMPERDFNESYEPQEVVLYAPPTRVYDEDSTTVDYVNGTFDSFNQVTWRGDGTNSLLRTIKLFIGGAGETVTSRLYMVTAICLVFVWWGVRKSVHMIMSAFRSGRLSFRDRKVRDRNSYYYGTRPSDWRYK